ncbi:MAG TPA: DUF3347 domain-containing protein [Bacteroidia bacterium]|nr:DUF3347 domain-containing protein [Bacteroidia bacterium]
MKLNLTTAALIILLSACTDKQEDAKTEEETVKTVTHQFKTVDEPFSEHVKNIIENYLLLKDNLVKTDAVSTIQSAEAIKKSIEGFDKKLLIANQREVYEKNISAIKTEIDDIIKLKDINQQREVFAELTENVYQLAIAFGYSKTLYYEHCPMALNDKGAMWLSTESEIRNPYFGDEMLSCGSVKEEIK